MVDMKFLNSFKKEVENMDGVTTKSEPPRYWFGSGNFVLNHIMSGSFDRFIGQGRLTGLAGPSGSGKSFVAGNVMAQTQREGAFNLAIDSENALDDGFVSAIGFDPTKDYMYVSAITIPQVVKIVSQFLKGYKAEYGDDPDAPKVHVTIDSLDMLLTETELENYQKGAQKGDQGQRNKQLKAMLRTFVQDIKNLNVTMVVTSQVYRNQDVLNGEGVWIVSDAVRYSLSQIALLTKLKLKDKVTKVVTGIKMKAEGYKTRFTAPFQNVVIEVPYETGIDAFSGLLETAKGLDIVEQKGSWYTISSTGDKFQAKNIADFAPALLTAAKAIEGAYLNSKIDDEELEEGEDKDETQLRRVENALNASK